MIAVTEIIDELIEKAEVMPVSHEKQGYINCIADLSKMYQKKLKEYGR